MNMKKNFFYAAAFAVGLAFASTACSNNDDPQPEPIDAGYWWSWRKYP